ncbi:MAG: thiol oxidoreductase [Acidobacteriaceae bacterium]|nr:thiol oxidoreductase [Acidobacteriaceae bacterium]
MIRDTRPEATGAFAPKALKSAVLLLITVVPNPCLLGQARDPGIRGGPPGAGQHISGLTAGQLEFFTDHAKPTFMEVEAVSNGLGPVFNLDSCAGCHAFPDIGGSSPPAQNPQVVRAASMAPGNRIPGFIKIDGPIREVRFKLRPNGSPDGGVHDIFTIAGRSDAPAGCAIAQPEFSDADNLSFRIPTPTFGGGLIEAIPDRAIADNLAADPTGAKAALHIQGHVNTNHNDGSVTRFGWKAQNKSLLIFAGEAYNVEMGVTNELFPNERHGDPTCAKNPTPESASVFNAGTVTPADIVGFMSFMKFLDQPAPACAGSACSPSIQRGRALFDQVGCALCHTPTLRTGASSTAALDHKDANLFSDLAVHHMGQALSDGITQGSAGPDEFRTAPLWGLGQRAFFLHDGRTSDLLDAIAAHDSDGSEASAVIRAFGSLPAAQQQDILDLLRSL